MENLTQTELSKNLNIVWHPHPVTPIAGREVIIATSLEGRSVREILITSGIDTHQPIMIWLDDRLLTVQEWDTICPSEGQLLNVKATVLGGASNILKTVALIAVVVVASVVSGGALAPVFGSAFLAGGVGALAAAAVIGIGGSMLVSAIFSPKVQNVGAGSALNTGGGVSGEYEKASPTYSLSGGSNNIRRYESMPVVFGNHRFFPDFAAKPFTQYVGEDQYLYQIFHLGLSHASTSNWKIGTNPIENYDNYSFDVSDSNGSLTAFPGNVDSTLGATLTSATGTIVRTTSENTYQISLDIEAILYHQTDYALENNSVDIKVEYRDAVTGGSYSPAPLGTAGEGFEWLGDGIFRITGKSQTPRRGSVFFNVASSSYDVAVTRLTPDSTDIKYKSDTAWSNLKSYQLDQADYSGQKRVGLSIKASEQLNGVIEKLSVVLNAEATYWNGTAWVTFPSSNPAHWFMHFAKGAYAPNGKLMYGIGLTDAQLDLEGLSVWADFCNTEGLTFNAVLDSNQTCAEVLDALSKCGFGSPSWASGKLGVVYDARDATPVASFGMANIVRDSFDVTYITEQLAEEIVVRFRNPDKDYEQDEVRVLVPDVTTPIRTSSLDLYGCTDQAMAGKFANYVAAQQFYRKRRITWESDFEGFVCQRGDVVLLSHDLTQWGYSGRIVETSDFSTITLDRAVPRNGQIEYLMLTRPDGTTTTYEIEAGTEGTESDTLTVLDDFIILQEGYLAMDHRWCFSPLATPGKKLKIISIQPVSESLLRITATDEYPEFYDAWDGTFIAPTQQSVLPAQPVTVNGLTVVSRPSIVNGYKSNQVTAYWTVGGGTQYCRVRVFFDGQLIAENSENLTNSFEIDVYSGGLFRIEVTPFGITGNGQTEVAQLTVDSLALPPPPTAVTLSVGEDGISATYTWSQVAGAQAYVVEVWSSGVQRRTVNVGNTLSWIYGIADAKADGGAFRSYSVRVYTVSNSGQSETYASVSFSNPQIGSLANANIEPMPNSIWFKYDRPTDDDFEGVKVWLSAITGFTPSDANLVYQGNQNWITIDADSNGNPLESSTVYYVRAAGYDSFGDDSLTVTSELSATVLSPAWGLVDGDITTNLLELGLQDRIDLIDTSGDPDMPGGLIAKVRQQSGELYALDTDVSTIGTKLLEAELKIQNNTDLLYDAGLTIDSNTGEVYIYAVKETQTELAAAEIRLTAAEADINLKASYTYVDDAITTAVIDPSQIAELGALTARVNVAEVDIDGLQAEIILKADSTTVGTLGARVTTAEADIDGLQGEIVLKASNTTVTALDGRVTTTEATLSTLDIPAITLAVKDVHYLNIATNEQAETQLRDILTGQANYDASVTGIAYAKQDLKAYTDGALLSEATSRLELAAALANTDAALINEQTVRATADSAEASARLALEARVTDAETGLISAQSAITTEQDTRAIADTALASSITTLESTVNNNNTTVNAAIQSEATTRANNDSALASSLVTVETTVGEHTTSIQTNSTSIDGIQGKYSVKVDNNGYVSGFGLISDANNATPFSEFTIIADRFSLSPVATNPTAEDGSPFFVITAPTSIGGVVIPAGTYMKAAFIHDATITTAKINDLAVNTAKIADASINAAKIIDATITTAKIGDAQITEAKIGTAAITEAKIGTAAITEAKIATAAITNAKIGAAAITEAKIADASITAAKIVDATITAAKITNATITGAKIANATITDTQIANAAITSAKIGDAQITSAKIAGFIQSDNYVSGSSGWGINKNGEAQFNNVTVRGNIEATSIKAGSVIVGTQNITGQACTVVASDEQGGNVAQAVISLDYACPVSIIVSFTAPDNSFLAIQIDGSQVWSGYNQGIGTQTIVRYLGAGVHYIWAGNYGGGGPTMVTAIGSKR